MAAADYLPEDYELYGREIVSYVQQAESKAKQTFGTQSPSFADAGSAAQRFQKAGAQVREAQNAATTQDSARLNRALIEAERALLIDQGLPNRPWFRHVIYAPGEYTGYAAVVIPGVNEAIEAKDLGRASAQLAILSGALNRAAAVLENYSQGRTGMTGF